MQQLQQQAAAAAGRAPRPSLHRPADAPVFPKFHMLILGRLRRLDAPVVMICLSLSSE
jgi:hypothetical protein